MSRVHPLWLCLALAVTPPLAAEPGDSDWKRQLEQIMANPDWIGPPVEAPFWSLDGQRILYALKREGSPQRDLWQVSLAGGPSRQLDASVLAVQDAAAPVFDAKRERAAFVRDGDVFVRHLADGRLQQLSRTPAQESSPTWSADGASLYWEVGIQWFRHDFASGMTAPLAELKVGKDPLAAKDDSLAADQLRLSSILQRQKDWRDAAAREDRERRGRDASLAPAPIWLGDEVEPQSSWLSPNGRWLLLVDQPKGYEAGRGGKMPKYVTESGYEEVEDVRTRVGRQPPAAHSLRLVDLADGSLRAVDLSGLPGLNDDPLKDLRQAAGAKPLEGSRPLQLAGALWHPDGGQAALMLRSNDNKDRWIVRLDPVTVKLTVEEHSFDPAWINDGSSDNPSFVAFGWVPKSNDLWWISEVTGFAHLYVKPARGKAKALTEGRWEATRVQWSSDGATAYLQCNRAAPGDYEVCAVDRQGRLRELTTLDGVEDFVLSPDGKHLAVLHSAHHTPPQLALLVLADGRLQTLTDTRSEAYRSRSWLPPQLVEVPSKHGAGLIHGKFYRPAELEPDRRYPIVLFVHGAGYLQNVSHRYPPYFREQMFHQLLVEHGYLVLDLDYRGSEGYGRDWRTAIYRQMGHPELEDYLDGIDWLVDSQQGDRERVGIYGGSYGGFMAFMALFRAPDHFKAGAALRPVTDWRHYNHGYSSNILNTPEIDPEAYRKSSPIEYAENFRGQLLISHGMIDDNVFYQDSVRLAQRLIELRKDGWELASYPLERHGYVHPESWYDQYRRIFELFQRSLQP